MKEKIMRGVAGEGSDLFPKERKVKKCACCEKPLNEEGDCPDGCTENATYGVAEGASWDEDDLIRESINQGFCLNCGKALIPDESGEIGVEIKWRCPDGCFEELLGE